MAHGTFFVIIGPSGVGKTTIVDEMLTHIPRSCRLVTSTSRQPREGERDGTDYHFLERADFERRIAAGEFLETNEFSGNLYGSSLKVLEGLLEEHVIVFGILDVNGARVVRERLPDAVTVFISPGSFAEIEERVRARAGVDGAQTEKRLATARDELAAQHEFHHRVVNPDGDLGAAVGALMALVFPYQYWYPERPPKPPE